jgi:hypothetical protein
MADPGQEYEAQLPGYAGDMIREIMGAAKRGIVDKWPQVKENLVPYLASKLPTSNLHPELDPGPQPQNAAAAELVAPFVQSKLSDAARIASYPGQVARGELDPSSPEGQTKALETAFNMALNGMTLGAVSPPKPNQLGMFIGPNARTANKNNLIDAFAMKERGASPTDIWHERGWWELPDKRWATEIPDDLARLKTEWPGLTDATYLRTRLEHPELLDAYPEMKTLTTIADQARGEGVSRFRGRDQYKPWTGENRVGIPKEAMDPALIGGTGPDDPLSVLMHELQHQVAGVEGWVPGSSPDYVIRLLTHQYEHGPHTTGITEQMANQFNQLPSLERQAMMHRLYQRDLGETMARATQYRMPLNQTERRARPPWLDFDVEPYVPYGHKSFGE